MLHEDETLRVKTCWSYAWR